MTDNEKFGIWVAEEMWKAKIYKCPFILNTEQATSLRKRWKELQKRNKKF